MSGERVIRSRATVVFVLIALWLFWLAIYVYVAVYVPAWQAEQAKHIEEAIDRDCHFLFPVTPASIRLTNQPRWSKIYPPTGREIVCSLSANSAQWRCSQCGDGP